ncbi:MAG: hypothetical protein WBB27_19825 [Maribacter sp.]
MKKIGFILTMAILLSSSNLLANDGNPQATKKLTHQISKMLEKDPIAVDSKGSAAEVRLTVDSFGRIHVLSINTSDENLEKFLKDKIQNRVVQYDSFDLGVIYRVPIEIAGEI